jgi:hypothetical protein
MQATGMVNDHTVSCFRRQAIIATYNETQNKKSAIR